MTSSSPWLDHKLRALEEKGPQWHVGPSDHVHIQWLTRAASRTHSVLSLNMKLQCPSLLSSVLSWKRVKPFINQWGGAERPSGSILSLHRSEQYKGTQVLLFSSHHLSEIPTRVSRCEPHVKSSPEPKERKDRRNMKWEPQNGSVPTHCPLKAIPSCLHPALSHTFYFFVRNLWVFLSKPGTAVSSEAPKPTGEPQEEVQCCRWPHTEPQLSQYTNCLPQFCSAFGELQATPENPVTFFSGASS